MTDTDIQAGGERPTLDTAGWDLLDLKARTANRFLDKPVDPALCGSSMSRMSGGQRPNSNPVRIAFYDGRRPGTADPLPVRQQRGALRSAPVVAVIGQDMEFFEYLPRLFPSAPENRKIFERNEIAAETNRSGTRHFRGLLHHGGKGRRPRLRAHVGFDNAGVDKTFFGGTHVEIELPALARLRRPGPHLSARPKV